MRARARAALTELGGADPDRNVGLTDYLLGQADPIGRADASRHLRDDPADHQLASELSDRLRELFPNAELPRLPGQPRSGGGLLRRTPAPASAPDAARPQAALSRSQTRLLVILGSAAVLLIAVVLAVTGVFGGDDDGGEATADSPTTTTASQSDERAVPITLRPEKGSDAGGAAIFGLATGDQPFIEFQIRNLEPAANGDAYVLWLLLGRRAGLPAADGAQRERQRIAQRPDPGAGRGDRLRPAGQVDRDRAQRRPEAQPRDQRGGQPAATVPWTSPAEPCSPRTSATRLRQQLPGIHDPGGVEALLERPQRLEPELAHLGAHVGRVVAPDRVVVGDRAAESRRSPRRRRS